LSKIINLLLENSYNSRLNRNFYIQKFFALGLLVTFALSNTPTKYLHYLFANHKDFVSKTLTDSHSPQINASGINCHCESNVVVVPYTLEHGLVMKALPPAFTEYTLSITYHLIISRSFSFGLRGPPAMV
jgi:hypothetical protein